MNLYKNEDEVFIFSSDQNIFSSSYRNNTKHSDRIVNLLTGDAFGSYGALDSVERELENHVGKLGKVDSI